MQQCSQITSCPLVEAMTPNFPRTLEFLKLKYCVGGNQRCAIFQRGGIETGESLIYRNIALVKPLIETEISGLTKKSVP